MLHNSTTLKKNQFAIRKYSFQLMTTKNFPLGNIETSSILISISVKRNYAKNFSHNTKPTTITWGNKIKDKVKANKLNLMDSNPNNPSLHLITSLHLLLNNREWLNSNINSNNNNKNTNSKSTNNNSISNKWCNSRSKATPVANKNNIDDRYVYARNICLTIYIVTIYLVYIIIFI